MDPMRWTLLGIGLVVLLAIYLVGLWRERRRASKGRAAAPHSGREDGGSGAGGAPRAERAVISDFDDPDPLAEQIDPSVDSADDALDFADELGRADTADPAGRSGPDLERGVGPEGPWWQDDGPAPDAASGPAAPPKRRAGSASSRGAPHDSAPAPSAGERKSPPPSASSPPEPGETPPPGASSPPESGEAPPAESPADAADRAAAAEPPPLKLPPASQLEMSAYRTGGIPEAEKLFVLFVVARDEALFMGPDIAAALESVRMVPGEYQIWHRRGDGELGRFTLFSVASMVEPGYLDPQSMPSMKTPGLAFFLQLPLPVDGEEALDVLMASAYQVADRLGGTLLDGSRSTLTRQLAEHLREELREHRRRLHIAVQKRGRS